MHRSAAVFALACALAGCGGDGGPSGDLAPDGPCEALWEVQLRLGTRIDGPVEATFRFADYTLFADGRVVGPDASACVTDIASQLATMCEPCRSAPGSCEGRVRELFEVDVPPACSACGDDVCLGDEDEASCPEDCLPRCGDGFCIAPETDASCPADCLAACGDGLCAFDETPDACPQDCNYTVGDGVCSPGENPAVSPADCQQLSCGDGFCQSYESTTSCPGDCCWPQLCGAGVTSCTGPAELSGCVVDGPGNCPGFAVLETCEASCIVDPASGLSRCRTCQEHADETLGFGATACRPGTDTTRCGATGTTIQQCVALADLAQCGIWQETACSGAACVDGQCVDCIGCQTGATRCTTDGHLEGCTVVAPNCVMWTTLQDCTTSGQTCTESASETRCCSPQPCASPGSAECVDSLTHVACIDDGICGGYQYTEPCEGTNACDVDPDDPTHACTPCCTPGDMRCAADGTRVQSCLTHPTLPECGQWSVSETCDATSSCADTGSGPACQPAP